MAYMKECLHKGMATKLVSLWFLNQWSNLDGLMMGPNGFLIFVLTL